ncbi:MAG: DNA-processing protein DprA [Pseudomonadota bacterium]
MNHVMVTIDDASYPIRLRATRDAPATLYVQGGLSLREPVVALVGSRAASGNGMAIAEELGYALAKRGALVISGGAVGIDAAAHRGALAAGGPTVVVLATGLDAPYPARNRPLFERIVEKGGALLTSFQPNVPVRRWHFPRRNRIMAGLADAVVVVEASPSSGSMYTAVAAREYGRVLGACPGTPGAEALLVQGAAVVNSADDVLGAIAGRPRQLAVDPPLPGSDEELVLPYLDPVAPRDSENVAALAGISVVRIARAMCALELAGLALCTPGGRYLRTALADSLARSAGSAGVGS